MKRSLCRRKFLLRAGTAAVATGVAAPVIARGRLEKPTVLGIGAGGKGRADLKGAADAGFDVIGLADVVDVKQLPQVKDKRTKTLLNVRQAYPQAAFGRDYRQMLADLGDKVDAVIISAPDHHHFHATALAMLAGKHVYCQKPLTHGIWEARTLSQLARMTGVKTQMGNQAHANDHMRRCVELIRAGIVGKVKEIHTWTNRPIWPQGFSQPPERQPIPKAIDWKQWIGPASWVDYNPVIAPFAWRGWWNFGTGALGDMACHIMDLGYWSMNPGAPLSVVAQENGATDISPPINSKITWTFPANAYSSKNGFKIYWYDGYVNGTFNRNTWKLDKSDDEYNHPGADVLGGVDFEQFGSVVIGEQGKLFFNRSKPEWHLQINDHVDGMAWPEPTLPRARQQDNYVEWYDAVQGTIPHSQSRFELAGPMTETILLGVLAQHVPGQLLNWDASKLSVRGKPELQKLIQRDYAQGWKTDFLPALA